MKIMKMIQHLTWRGGSGHRFDDFTDTKDQPSKFIGRCTGEFSTTESWFTPKTALVNRLRKVLKAANAHGMTMLEDLPSMQPGKLGRGVFIKNRQGLFDPQKFYLMLQKGDYAFGNPQWENYFPAFESAIEAHRGIHALLGIFYKMQRQINQKLKGSQEEKEEKQMSFVRGQLVMVKCEAERVEKPDDSSAYEIRRGYVENVAKEPGINSQYVYTVYLLDYGFYVEVTAAFLSPLPHPFDTIAPLATQCSLYGISPIGAKWDYQSKDQFSNVLRKHSDHIFIVDVLSDHHLLPIVDIDICDFEAKIFRGRIKIRIRFQQNPTQFLIDSQRGAQWNLFPSRPKLMAGVTPTSPEALHGPQNLPRVTISYRDALLIAPVILPVAHKHLPLPVISRELKKLFRLRDIYLVDVYGVSNYLALRTPDPNNIFCTPCTIEPFNGNEDDDNDYEE